MTTKIQKWGNSLALRIPKSFAEAINLKAGTNINLKLEKNRLVVSKDKKQNYKLNELLLKISDKNIHKEIDYGKPAGKELI